ncbi:MAG: hypothetical protein QOE02_2315 [Rhodospirillaceae bacterium]|jgi:hypothetical protein|nr:hypothetical protein [Rhodospirillaceae bacterium]MEA2852296.1 hypothetical protein [Rhodospirillaceae bacterium]
MDRGIRAALSPNEARTLCRIAADMAPRAMLAARDVAQRLKLQLVREEHGKLELTALGGSATAGSPARSSPAVRPERSTRGVEPALQANEGRPGGALPMAKPIERSYSASGIP